MLCTGRGELSQRLQDGGDKVLVQVLSVHHQKS